MKSVFILQHSRPKENGNEDVKLIGIYSTLKMAEQTVERFKSITGFKDYPNSFYIDEYEIDQDNWTEGFGIEY